MTRYQLENAKNLVYGYLGPTRGQQLSRSAAFTRAKSECVSQLEGQLERVKSLTEEQFYSAKK